MTFAWAKLWIETLDDWKMGQLSDHLWRRFFEFVLLAKTQDEAGYLPDPRAMAWRLRCSVDEILADLDALSVDDLQLITQDGDRWIVTNFAKRQEAPMDSAERMRRLRDREKRAAYAEDETPTLRNDECDDTSDDTCDEIVTERHTDKTRQDKTIEERQEEDAEAPLSPSNPPSPLERHTLLPDEIPKPDPVLGECWKTQMLPYLAASVEHSVYDRWFVPITPIAVVDSTVLLGVNEHYECAWCAKVHGTILRRTIAAFLERPLDIQFVAFPPGGT